MSNKKLHAIGAAGRWPPKNSSVPSQRSAGSDFHRSIIASACCS